MTEATKIEITGVIATIPNTDSAWIYAKTAENTSHKFAVSDAGVTFTETIDGQAKTYTVELRVLPEGAVPADLSTKQLEAIAKALGKMGAVNVSGTYVGLEGKPVNVTKAPAGTHTPSVGFKGNW